MSFNKHEQNNQLETFLEKIYQNKKEINLGLTRIKKIANKLDLLKDLPPIILVAGTNGKGSTVKFLESYLSFAKITNFSFTSPHILEITERIKINQQQVQRARLTSVLMNVYEKSEQKLTYFELLTLSALKILKQEQIQVAIFEVGLGARLDATNILDPIISVISSIGFDHKEYLGNTLEEIAFEKAHVFRKNKIAIVSCNHKIQSYPNYAKKIGAILKENNKDFFITKNQSEFIYQDKNQSFSIKKSSLHPDNIANSLSVLTHLLPVFNQKTEQNIIDQTLENLSFMGRFFKIKRTPDIYLDVAHNYDSAKFLSANIRNLKKNKDAKIYAVFSALDTKDLAYLELFKNKIDKFYIAKLNTSSAANLEKITCYLKKYSLEYLDFNTIKDAYSFSCQNVKKSDKIICFGSFHLVQEILQACQITKV